MRAKVEFCVRAKVDRQYVHLQRFVSLAIAGNAKNVCVRAKVDTFVCAQKWTAGLQAERPELERPPVAMGEGVFLDHVEHVRLYDQPASAPSCG